MTDADDPKEVVKKKREEALPERLLRRVLEGMGTVVDRKLGRTVDPRSGLVSRVVGTGTPGQAGIGGPPEMCQLNRPHGAQRHPVTGAIYVSDSENHRVLRVE